MLFLATTIFSTSGRETPKMQKCSAYISRKTVQNIFRAFDFAAAARIPFNVYVVINIIETDAKSAATMFELVRHKYRDWLAYKARRLSVWMPPIYVYSFEAPTNPHVNWVLRVPPRYLPEFQKKLPRWIERVQGPLRDFDLSIQIIQPDNGYKTLANYIVKGCHPSFVEHFYLSELHAQHGPQGEFFGKRAGVSPSLNKSARAAAGYDPRSRRLGSPKEGEFTVKDITHVA